MDKRIYLTFLRIFVNQKGSIYIKKKSYGNLENLIKTWVLAHCPSSLHVYVLCSIIWLFRIKYTHKNENIHENIYFWVKNLCYRAPHPKVAFFFREKFVFSHFCSKIVWVSKKAGFFFSTTGKKKLAFQASKWVNFNFSKKKK